MINFVDENDLQHSALVECKKTKGVNGEKSLSGTIYTNDEILEGIGRGWRLQFEDENYCLTYVNPVDEGTRIVVEFDAVHEFFFDLQKSVVYSELNGSNTADAYLKHIFSGSGYEYRLEITIPAFEKQNFGMKNRLELFKDFISSTGVEFSVNGKIVRILEKVGTNLSTIVKKGFNLNELRIEKDAGSFITYLKGYGAFLDPEDESKGRLEVEYLSPLASVYGKLEGNPIVDERYKKTDSLLSRLKQEVEDSYAISVSIDMEDLTSAGYSYEQPHEGDYILAINKDLGFEQKIRIISYTTSYDTQGNILDHEVSCGSDNIIKKAINEDNNFRDEVLAGLENAIGTANQAWISADGKNKVFMGPNKPTASNKGDIWYQIDGEQTIMHYWDGYDWIPFINPDAVNQAIDEAQKAGEAAEEAAKEALEETEKLKTEADKIKIDVSGVLDSINDINTDITNITNTVAQVEIDANSALKRVAQVELDASGIRQTVVEVQKDLNGLSTETASQITQLSKTIDLKVSKGDVINQINISTEGILIDGKKIHITGQTVIDNGVIKTAQIADLSVSTAKIANAAITDAKIGNISANKITTGTLNAASVNIINMNAANITTGYLSASRIAAKSITADKMATNAIMVGLNGSLTSLQISSTEITFKQNGTKTGALTDYGQEFWYGSRKIGYTGETYKTGSTSTRGIGVNLEYTGDFVSWGYKTSSSASVYTNALLLDPRGKFSGLKGLISYLPIYPQGGIGIKSAYQNLGFMVSSFNNTSYPYLGAENGKAGLAYGSTEVYLISGGYYYSMSKVIKALSGLGTVAIAKSFRSDGTAASWYNLSL